MKYIRTKDGIIDRDSALPHMVVDGYIDFNSLGRFKIIKQADTIEELCDEFVCVDERCGHRIALLSGNIPQGVKLYTYGAIWTDKGLIYVAKMNEKGELELI